MTGAEDDLVSDRCRAGGGGSGRSGRSGLQCVEHLERQRCSTIATAAAIAKAITGAYLSSGGNAFTTRTASQIVQENFNPGSRGLEGGPLFGVQFSQLPCSDLAVRFDSDTHGGTIDPPIGPKRSPLGFVGRSGRPAALQERHAGRRHRRDRRRRLRPRPRHPRPRRRPRRADRARRQRRLRRARRDLRADRIAVDGRSLRFADRERARSADRLVGRGRGRPGGRRGLPGRARLLRRRRRRSPGTAFGFGRSGIRPDPDDLFDNEPRLRPDRRPAASTASRRRPAARARTALSAAEVTTLLAAALERRARGARRRSAARSAATPRSRSRWSTPPGRSSASSARPMRRSSASTCRCRRRAAAMFFSSPAAAADLRSVRRRMPTPPAFRRRRSTSREFRAFLGADALSGEIAYRQPVDRQRRAAVLPRRHERQRERAAQRAVRRAGARSTPACSSTSWRTTSSQHLLFVLGELASDDTDGGVRRRLPRLANGLQIFSGGVPIYRGDALVGGIGVSGDGIDQDDMIAFLGLDRAGGALGTASAMRRARSAPTASARSASTCATSNARSRRSSAPTGRTSARAADDATPAVPRLRDPGHGAGRGRPAGGVGPGPGRRGARDHPPARSSAVPARRSPRRRPPAPPTDPSARLAAAADAFPDDFVPLPDRWRLIENLGVNERWYDPYNQNTLKGDRPIFGEDWFVMLSAISDTVIEPRSTPMPVGIQTGDARQPRRVRRHRAAAGRADPSSPASR